MWKLFLEKDTRLLAYWVIKAIEEYTQLTTLKFLQKFSLDCDYVHFYYFNRSGNSGPKALGVT